MFKTALASWAIHSVSKFYLFFIFVFRNFLTRFHFFTYFTNFSQVLFLFSFFIFVAAYPVCLIFSILQYISSYGFILLK